jgi:hypothetical protein
MLQKNKQICCYKCQSTEQLLVEEKVTHHTGRVIEKNFICFKCAGGEEKLFNGNS